MYFKKKIYILFLFRMVHKKTRNKYFQFIMEMVSEREISRLQTYIQWINTHYIERKKIDDNERKKYSNKAMAKKHTHRHTEYNVFGYVLGMCMHWIWSRYVSLFCQARWYARIHTHKRLRLSVSLTIKDIHSDYFS